MKNVAIGKCMGILLIYSLFMVFSASFVFGQHIVWGQVFNAADGTSANGKTVVVYYPGNPDNNESDVIGIGGASGFDNEFLVDVEIINVTYDTGDVLFVRVLDDGSRYFSGPVSVILNESVLTDIAPNMTINTPPTLPSPVITSEDSTNFSDEYINCSYVLSDLDNGTKFNVTVRWFNNSVLFLTSYFNYNFDNGTNFNTTISAGNTHVGDNWSCSLMVYDNYTYSGWGNSSNLTILNAPPLINSIFTNPTEPIEDSSVFIFANVTDGDAIVWVNFTVIAPNGSIIVDNVNASSSAGDIWNSSSFFSSAIGVWSWNLTAFDGFSSTDASGSFTISSWHVMVGNVSGQWVLSSSVGSSMLNWSVADVDGSNLFVMDSDSSVSFSDLLALGRNISGIYFADDFVDLDSLINMTSLVDSVNSTYTYKGNPRETDSFNLYGIAVSNVPIVNSTSNGNFSTGILWDSGDDSGDGQFDLDDIEDVVFVSSVNPSTWGKYGFYDYEISFPAYLRKLKTTSLVSVSIYVEIK